LAKELPKREDIAEERTWRLEDIFESDEAWNKEYDSVKELIPQISEYQGKLHESADTLYNLLTLQDEVAKRFGKLFTYAHMRYDQDTTNSHYQEMNTRAENLLTQVGSAMSYIDPEILAMEEGTVEKFLQEKEELKLYEHALNEITRGRPHTLSEKEEALLAQAGEVMGNPAQTFGMLNNADLTFPTIQDEEGNDVDLTHGRYIRFLQSKDRSVRKAAFEAMYDTFGSFKNTFASTLSGAVKKHNFSANIRNYDSARHAALDKNNIPEKVHDNLVEAVNDRLPALHRYVELRKEVLGVDELHMYDLYADLVQDVDMDIPYEEAQELVLKGLAPLGDEYTGILQEGGHSLHSYYTTSNQPYRYGNYSIFVAEVASTCNEALLNDYLLKETTDKKRKLYLLNNFLEGFRGTVYRQTMFAEFEHDIHKREQNGEALTADKLTELYHDLNEKYFGKNIVVDDDIGLEWARIPHFYMNYYVYQYATGYSAATALADQILKEGDQAVERYKGFLKAGSSDYPIEVLKQAGVDMTSKDPIEAALDVFEEKLDEFEKLIKE